VPVAIRAVFGPALERVLNERPRIRLISFGVGEKTGEVRCLVLAQGREAPIRIRFPNASDLTADDVLRVLGNVFEAMGPNAP
jgi:hypothetical protein